jgi:hypothetical protein
MRPLRLRSTSALTTAGLGSRAAGCCSGLLGSEAAFQVCDRLCDLCFSDASFGVGHFNSGGRLWPCAPRCPGGMCMCACINRPMCYVDMQSVGYLQHVAPALLPSPRGTIGLRFSDASRRKSGLGRTFLRARSSGAALRRVWRLVWRASIGPTHRGTKVLPCHGLLELTHTARN